MIVVVQICVRLKVEAMGSNERPDVGLQSVMVDINKRSYAKFKKEIVGNSLR